MIIKAAYFCLCMFLLTTSLILHKSALSTVAPYWSSVFTTYINVSILRCTPQWTPFILKAINGDRQSSNKRLNMQNFSMSLSSFKCIAILFWMCVLYSIVGSYCGGNLLALSHPHTLLTSEHVWHLSHLHPMQTQTVPSPDSEQTAKYAND